MAVCGLCNKKLTVWESLKAGKIRLCSRCKKKPVDVQPRTLQNLSAMPENLPSLPMGPLFYRRFNTLPPSRIFEAPTPPHTTDLSTFDSVAIPTVPTDIHLDSDEIAHFDHVTTYYKPNKRMKLVPGRLVGTSKRLYFVSDTGKDSATIDWGRISKVDEKMLPDPLPSPMQGGIQAVHITLLKSGAGGGTYAVADAHSIKVLIDLLVRLWRYQLVQHTVYAEIPHHIKSAVYYRDQGQCVSCGYQGQYLEYDHIIPRSKGGTSTYENIQLLCRDCNLHKSSKL